MSIDYVGTFPFSLMACLRGRRREVEGCVKHYYDLDIVGYQHLTSNSLTYNEIGCSPFRGFTLRMDTAENVMVGETYDFELGEDCVTISLLMNILTGAVIVGKNAISTRI